MYSIPEKTIFFIISVFLPPFFVWLVTMTLQVAALSVFTSCLTVMFVFFVCLYCWIIIRAVHASDSLIVTPKALAVTTASVLGVIWVLSYLSDLEIKNYYFLSLSIIFCSMLLFAYFVLEKIAKVSLMCLIGSDEGQKEKLFYLLCGLGALFAAFSFLEPNSYDASLHIVLNVYTVTAGVITAYIFGSYYLMIFGVSAATKSIPAIKIKNKFLALFVLVFIAVGILVDTFEYLAEVQHKKDIEIANQIYHQQYPYAPS